jgi:hypothetical protein
MKCEKDIKIIILIALLVQVLNLMYLETNFMINYIIVFKRVIIIPARNYKKVSRVVSLGLFFTKLFSD